MYCDMFILLTTDNVKDDVHILYILTIFPFMVALIIKLLPLFLFS